jgi:hypothetical protein
MDGGDVLHLGTEFAAWQIKDFSVALRKAITEAARRQDATNAEWLHGHFTRYGLDGVEVARAAANPANFTGQTAADLAHLIGLAEAAAKLAAAPDLPVVTTARRAVRAAILAGRPQRLLPAPNKARTPDSQHDSADESGA